MASARSLLRSIAPSLYARIGKSHHHRKLLSSAALQETSSSPAGQDDGVHMTENCIRRMKELHFKEESNKGKMLRLSVENGGCSGFQYVFGLEDKRNEDDRSSFMFLKEFLLFCLLL
uniref:Iron-sulfur assembly protein IscA-like 2, mitochondrial n=1 Tax=Anthurium amnicola TaxID=1678845 RepID=A0A1D1XJ25_9ARAE